MVLWWVTATDVGAFIPSHGFALGRSRVIVRDYNKEGLDDESVDGALGAAGDASDEVSISFRRRSRVLLESADVAADEQEATATADGASVLQGRSLEDVPVFLVSPGRVLVPGARRSIHCYDTSLLGALEAARESGAMVSRVWVALSTLLIAAKHKSACMPRAA